METPTQPTAWERTTIRRLLRWLFRWQTVRRTLIALAWVVTLIALLYGEENWRGRRAWNNYRQEQEARGAQFDLKAFIPEPIPDEQNFAATPFIQSWFPKGLQWEDNYSQLADKISNPQEPVERGRRHFNNLVGWEMAFDALQSGKVKKSRTFESTRLDRESRARAAPAVLAGLKDNDAIWAELRAVSQRPHCRYPVTYDLENPWGILLPHLARIKGACQRLQLRASAELAAGQTDQAFDDVKLTLQLADTLKDEIFLVSYLVRAACFQLALQPVWEGLAEHRWSEAQLLELQTRFLRYDFLTDFQRPRDAERAAIVLTAELLHRHKYRLSDLSEPLPGAPRSTIDTEFAELLGRIAPRGWYHLEQVNACEVYRNQSAGAFDPAQKRISPRLLKADAGEFERKFSGERAGKVFSALLRHQILAATLLPGLSKLPIKVAMAQTAADQAALACALERFRLADGQFPETLAALVPRFLSQLPKDALTGDAYKYRRTADGQFVLYSVGWDEKDDGGMVGDSIFDEKEGDWVWQYPSR